MLCAACWKQPRSSANESMLSTICRSGCLRFLPKTNDQRLAFMTWIKICGITNLEDATTAVDAGADALGFVFHDKSPRRVEAAAVRDILDHLPEHIEKVGVFVDAGTDYIRDVVSQTGLTMVQLHGRQSLQ